MTIRPVWTDVGLEFRDLSGQSIVWHKEEFPYLQSGMPVAYENNLVRNQKKSGYGVVASFTGNTLTSWTGNTDRTGVVVNTDPKSSVKVMANASDWRTLYIPMDQGLLSPKDFLKYPSTPLSPLLLSAFQAVPLDWIPEVNIPARPRLNVPVKIKMGQRLRALEESISRLEYLLPNEPGARSE